MFGYIYKTTCLINGKIYVGKKHKSTFDPKYYGSGIRLAEAIIQYGRENFVIEVLDWAEDVQTLNALEKKWIKDLNSRNPEIGYNVSAGGTSFCCQYHKEETKKKISESMKHLLEKGDFRKKGNCKKTPETREKLRQRNLGHSVSEETRRKISDKIKGHHHTEEVKEKIRAAFIGKKRPDWVVEKMRKSQQERRAREKEDKG